MAILYKKIEGVFVMKKTSKILVSLFIFINIFTINIFAEDLAYIEEALIHIGIDEEYSENIVQYLEGISITESDVQKIENNINDIKSFIEDSKNEEEINFLKYYSVYDNIMDISEVLNLDLDFDINNLNIRLIDKKNNNVLFEGDINSLVQIYSNYKDGNYNISVETIVKEINLNIKENNSEEKLNNSENQVNNKINNSLKIERNSTNNSNNNEINAVLDEYIDKFDKYNESLLVKNDNDILELKIIAFIFAISVTILVILKKISVNKKIE